MNQSGKIRTKNAAHDYKVYQKVNKVNAHVISCAALTESMSRGKEIRTFLYFNVRIRGKRNLQAIIEMLNANCTRLCLS